MLTNSRWASVKALAGQKLLLVNFPDADPSLCSTTQHLHTMRLVCTFRFAANLPYILLQAMCDMCSVTQSVLQS